MLKKECTMKQYEIEIDDLMAIVETDNDHEDDDDWNEILSEKLDMVNGVTDSDYNGHFGHYIFLKIDSKYDTPATWNTIETVINDHIKTKE
jgi:hypothetical protein